MRPSTIFSTMAGDLPVLRACSVSSARFCATTSAGMSSRETHSGELAATCMAIRWPMSCSASALPALSSATSTPIRPRPGAAALWTYGATTPSRTDTKADRRKLMCSPVLAVRRAITSRYAPVAVRRRGVQQRAVIAAHAERDAGERGRGVLERLGARHEIRFRVELDDGARCSLHHQAHEPFGRHTVGLSRGFRELCGAQPIDGGFEIALRPPRARSCTRSHRRRFCLEAFSRGWR